ncbi:nucleoporin protein Ndc1-Nup [Annulohypoxylon maeteangense]|uniref:nucleoporin protein Ndc1-Nup n=1 Tax=Annulohypoxylon maeteangense TaxID=1927788 RepID=UPI0020085E64|nr:nucleoporin protein Ndc1-Nup [Annulohypoxylon maeteangense]KAI0882667.1 nucleoporin protein Ndc1-Nup [Annulohypoxylon maeteangense]
MPPAAARRAPYKDFLQPALQRRFASTTGFLLAISYIEALTLSRWNHIFWPWLPIGLPGIRTLAIFGSILPIIILRIAHSHIGIRTSNSPFDTFRRTAISLETIETIITFTISAWMFSQIYLFSTPTDANLSWITYYSGDRARLNERALFYTVNLVILGSVQGFLHKFLDFDQMVLGKVRPRREGQLNNHESGGWERLGEWAPVLVIRAGTVSMAVGFVNYLVTYHFVRRSAWSWALSFFRLFYSLPKSNIPPSQAPWSIWMLGRSVWAGFLLCLLWYFGDIVFRLQLGKAPLKNNQPLSAESKDPNGSLLNGLKSKKPRVSAFALWELALIARDFDDRRRSVFEDIDRKDGPMWSQIYVTCLETIKSLEERVDNYGKPPAPPAAPAAAAPQPAVRVVQPPKTDNVWATAPSQNGLRNSLGRVARNVVTSPGKTPADVYLPEAKKVAREAAEHFLTEEQRNALSPQGVSGLIQTISLRIINLPRVGQLFQQVFSRRLTTIVLGQPHGELSIYINAAYALSKLAVSSLTEDKYGNVQRDVPAIIRTFTTVIKKLERFRDNLPAHWTDPVQNRECPEVDELLDALKEGLGELIAAFGRYSSDLRLTRADMRLAAEAAVRQQAAIEAGQQAPTGPEMQQVH